MLGRVRIYDCDDLDAPASPSGIEDHASVTTRSNKYRLHPTRHSRGMIPIISMRAPLWKRVEDLTFGVTLTVLALPLLAVSAIAIVAESGLPVFYIDERIGLGGKPFRAFKFRTMVVGALEQGLGRLVSVGDPRITRVGAALRRWSLDEVPQLLNVIRGDMSIVGPRPTYAQQVARYTARDAGRLRVKPGITGLAQVSGRNDLSWRQRIDLDLTYIDRLSVWLDLSILLRTPFVVLAGIGLYGKGGVTPDYEPDETT
jgi:lipopolysaccharide/colanic/teichoic acid biosynthesis glycosyltransferase